MAGEDVIAELAVRLGSIVSFDRHGDVIFLESFESGLKRIVVHTSGTGAAVVLSVASARTGGYSAKLTAGSDASKYAWVEVRLTPSLKNRLGFEVSWARVPSGTYIEIFLAYFPVGAYHYGALRVDVDADKWQYLDADAAWQDLEIDLTLYTADSFYHTMKLVVDFDSAVYVRAMLDEFVGDVVDVPLRGATIAAGPYLLCYVALTETASANPYIYLDDLVITRNEP